MIDPTMFDRQGLLEAFRHDTAGLRVLEQFLDPDSCTAQKLIDMLLGEVHELFAWKRLAVIHPRYMPPYPGPDTKPTCQIQLGKSFLRQLSRNFMTWDIYGSDFRTPEAALMALSRAPVPPWLIDYHRMSALRETVSTSPCLHCATEPPAKHERLQ